MQFHAATNRNRALIENDTMVAATCKMEESAKPELLDWLEVTTRTYLSSSNRTGPSESVRFGT